MTRGACHLIKQAAPERLRATRPPTDGTRPSSGIRLVVAEDLGQGLDELLVPGELGLDPDQGVAEDRFLDAGQVGRARGNSSRRTPRLRFRAGYAVLSMAAPSRMPTGIHAQARRAAAKLAHEVSSTSCASLDPPDLYSPMTERSTW
jgi:hypothetical protein